MKIFKSIIIILVIFFKTGNVLSENKLFNVNNIEITNNLAASNEKLANEAIKQGYKKLINRILLEDDIRKLSNLDFVKIKELVQYYQITSDTNDNKKFNIFFDKDKLHELFYNNAIPYSEIIDKEIYLLPIFKKKDQIYIYSKNYFYSNWNEINNEDLIEFILPIENIETIEKINSNIDNVLDIDLRNLFQEISNKNIALIFIEDTGSKQEKIFLKTKIMGKNISKSLIMKRSNFEEEQFFTNIIMETKKELVNLIKSQNLIDIRVPSFINIEFSIDRENNLVELSQRIKNIDLIENIYVQEFNNEAVYIKIKYLGKIDKVIEELKKQNIILKLIKEQWNLKII